MNIKSFYWVFFPVLLFLLQLLFTLNSFSHLTGEEVVNSLRNPYWLQHRLVYSSIYSWAGWDIPMMILYNVFGFHIFTAKFFKLALCLISLFCLAAILRRYLRPGPAVFSLITIGLSPTLLYFNTMQAHYGIDLLYFPIIFFLIAKINPRGKWSLLLTFKTWFIAMVAALSYSSFLFSLPILLAFYIKRIFSTPKNILVGLFAFLLPLVLFFAYVQNRHVLIYDPETGSGLFRGGNISAPTAFGTLDYNLKFLMSDLFVGGESYQFTLKQAEFSHVFPIFSFLFVFGWACLATFKNKKLRPFLLLLWGVLFFNLAVYLSLVDVTQLPGIRRATAILIVFYILFVLLAKIAFEKPTSHFKKLAVLALSLVLAHHAIVYPINLINVKDPDSIRYLERSYWLPEGESPAATLQNYFDELTQKDLMLDCRKSIGNPLVCSYSDIYGALAGACLWNRLPCHTIYGYDPVSDKFIPLTIDLWRTGYFVSR